MALANILSTKMSDQSDKLILLVIIVLFPHIYGLLVEKTF